MNDASERTSRRTPDAGLSAASGPSEADRCLAQVRRHPLSARVASRLRDHCGVHPEPAVAAGRADAVGGRARAIVVGCSGGPDSVALLLVLAALARRRRERWPQPIAVTIDHGLRSEATDECAAVEALARRLGIACERLRIDPGKRAGNLAANARADRLEALAEVAKRLGATWIALGHHADDRLETLLLGLARGRGLRGLSHPAWRRSLAARGGRVDLVRPLLDTPKSACEELCREVDIAVVRDPGNADRRRARGALRVDILPALTARWPSIAIDASHAVDEAGVAVRFIERAARRLMDEARLTTAERTLSRRWRRETLRAADPILRRWALRSALLRGTRGSARERVRSIQRVTWERLARAIGDQDRRPRRFELREVGIVTVRATVVQFTPTGRPR